jgi:hypothetical protein
MSDTTPQLVFVANLRYNILLDSYVHRSTD